MTTLIIMLAFFCVTAFASVTGGAIDCGISNAMEPPPAYCPAPEIAPCDNPDPYPED